MLLKGCSCILSSPKLIGLEHLLALSPGLIGMEHKHMERRRAPAAGLTAAINVSKCNHIRRTCALLPVLRLLGSLCAHGRRSTLSKQGQWKPVISFRTWGGGGISTSFFSPPHV